MRVIAEVTQEEFDRIVNEDQKRGQAFARENFQQRQRDFIKIGPLDLSVAEVNGYKLPVPLRGIVMKSSDLTTSKVKVITGSNDDAAKADGYPLELGEKINFYREVGYAILTWEAQAGGTNTYLYVYLNSNVDGGKTYSVNSGGVTISEGATITTRAKAGLTLTTLTATAIVPLNLSRVGETIQNNTAQTLWLGDANVTDDLGAYPGYKFEPGDTFYWKNTAALYAYNPGATLTSDNISRNLETN